MTPLSRSDLHSEVFRVMNLYFKKRPRDILQTKGFAEILPRFYSHCTLFRIGNSETRSFPIDWRLIGAGVFCSPFQYGEPERLCCLGSGETPIVEAENMGIRSLQSHIKCRPRFWKGFISAKSTGFPSGLSKINRALGIQPTTTNNLSVKIHRHFFPFWFLNVFEAK